MPYQRVGETEQHDDERQQELQAPIEDLPHLVRKCVDVHEHSAEEFHAEQAERLGDQAAVAYTRPLFGST